MHFPLRLPVVTITKWFGLEDTTALRIHFHPNTKTKNKNNKGIANTQIAAQYSTPPRPSFPFSFDRIYYLT